MPRLNRMGQIVVILFPCLLNGLFVELSLKILFFNPVIRYPQPCVENTSIIRPSAEPLYYTPNLSIRHAHYKSLGQLIIKCPQEHSV